MTATLQEAVAPRTDQVFLKCTALLVLGLTLMQSSVVALLNLPGAQTLQSVACIALLSLCCTARLFRHQSLRALPGLVGFAVYVLAGLASSAARDVPSVLALSGSLSFIKGPLVGLAVCQLDWRASDLRRLGRVAGVFAAFVLLAGLMNALVPAPWTAALSPGFEARGGSLPTLIGPFTLPGSFGQVCSLIVIAILAYTRVRPSSGTVLAKVAVAAAALGVVLSFRRRALIALLLGIVAVRGSVFRRPGVLLAGIFLAPIVLVAGWQPLANKVDKTAQEYVETPNAPRNLLYHDSVMLANDYIPLGAGFSRFGSYLSGVNYSPEYSRLGYASIDGLKPGVRGLYFTDTFWPAILGEAGWVGAAAFVTALLKGHIFARRSNRRLAGGPQILSYVVLGWGVNFAVESLAAPVYSSPPTFALLFFALGLLTAVSAAVEEGVT